MIFSDIISQLNQMSNRSVCVQQSGNDEKMSQAAQIAQLGQAALKLLEQRPVSAKEWEKNYKQLAEELTKCQNSVWKGQEQLASLSSPESKAEKELRDQIQNQIRIAYRFYDLGEYIDSKQESSKETVKTPDYQLTFICHSVLDSKMIGSTFHDTGMYWMPVNVWMLEHLRAYRDQLTDPAKKQQINRLIYDLERQEKYAYIMSYINGGFFSDEVKARLIQEIWVDIQNLQPGERVVMQGGYERHLFHDAGHAVEYVIERQTNGKFSFTIINTGEGADISGTMNSFRKLIGGKPKVYDLVWKDIAPDQMNQGFLKQLLEPRFPSGPRTDMATIVSGVEVALQKKADRGRLHNIQKQRSCLVKSLVSSIHERLPPATFWEFKAFYTERELAGLDTKLEASNLYKTLLPPKFAQAKDQFKAEAQEVLKKRQEKCRQANQP